MPTAGENFYSLEPADQVLRLYGLAEAALGHWEGRFGRVTLVKYRENAVFSAWRDDGTQVALRIHRPGYHCDAALHSELEWMQSLSREGIAVPPVVPCSDGRALVNVAADGVPEARQVDMLLWLDGSPIGSAENGLELDELEASVFFHDVGALAARLHNHSSRWERPADFTRHAWDDEGLIGSNPFWGRYLDLPILSASQRLLLRDATTRAAGSLARFGKGSDRYGLIHADFVPENLLKGDQGLMLIDFDDAGFGWHMFEVATALFFNVDEPNYPAIVERLIAGYRTQRPLPDTQLALLPLFLFLRGTTYLGWMQTRSETQTARELAPMLAERTCRLASDFLLS